MHFSLVLKSKFSNSLIVQSSKSFPFLHSSLWHFSKSSTIHSFPFFKKSNSFSKTLIFFSDMQIFFSQIFSTIQQEKFFFSQKKKRKTFRSTFRRFWRNFIIVQTKFYLEIKKIILTRKILRKIFEENDFAKKEILTKMKNWFWNENFIEKCERMCEVWGEWRDTTVELPAVELPTIEPRQLSPDSWAPTVEPPTVEPPTVEPPDSWAPHSWASRQLSLPTNKLPTLETHIEIKWTNTQKLILFKLI